jgi:hypothetical protein
MPAYRDEKMAGTYWQFLNEKNDKVLLRNCQFNQTGKCWDVGPDQIEGTRPKFDFSLGWN